MDFTHEEKDSIVHALSLKRNVSIRASKAAEQDGSKTVAQAHRDIAAVTQRLIDKVQNDLPIVKTPQSKS